MRIATTTAGGDCGSSTHQQELRKFRIRAHLTRGTNVRAGEGSSASGECHYN